MVDPTLVPFLNRKQFDFEEGASFKLNVDIWSNSGGTIQITGMTKSGPFTFALAVPTDGLQDNFELGIPDIPVLLAVDSQSNSVFRGMVYCKVGLLINSTIVGHLVSGYVTSAKSLSYPYGQNEHSMSGRGRMRQIDIADPAAGVELANTLVTGKITRIHAFRGTLVTDATASNRMVSLSIPSTGDNIVRVPAITLQTASLTIDYVFGIGLAYLDDTIGLRKTAPLPSDLWLDSATAIATIVTNIQAGDNWSEGNLWIEELIDGS